MIELIVGTYGALCWLLFSKLKIVPITTYTVCTAILGGVVILVFLLIGVQVCHPVSYDGRMYSNVTNIVPAVRGQVIEVLAQPDKPMRKGDVLFKLDPRPFQFEVERLQAALDTKKKSLARLKEQLAAAEAITRAAEAKAAVEESTSDRQARENLEQATSQVAELQKQLNLAKTQTQRYGDLLAKNAVSREEFDKISTAAGTAKERVDQAKNQEKIAREKFASGGSSIKAAREEVNRARAVERDLLLDIEAESNGITSDVRQAMAELDMKRWELEQTEVRAPYDGFVPQVVLRPGQMAAPIPLAPLMVYVSDEKPKLIATFHQTVVMGFEPGMHAEVAFKAHPGRVFKAHVVRVATAIREGELDPSGNLLSGTPATAPGFVPVFFEYDEDIGNLKLPIGSQATVAVYTHRLHALGFLRMMVLRIKSWENFLFGFELPGH
jgi:multidrug resistance efflux pump